MLQLLMIYNYHKIKQCILPISLFSLVLYMGAAILFYKDFQLMALTLLYISIACTFTVFVASLYNRKYRAGKLGIFYAVLYAISLVFIL